MSGPENKPRQPPETTGGKLLDRIADAYAGQYPAASGNRDFSGQIFGSYRLLERVGRGGMGEVYRAERADGAYQNQVAVKLLRASIDSELQTRRFHRERQLLARLDHPGIARLLDGGSGPQDIPFLVMEWVEGEPITEHIQRLELNLERRLALFAEVCRAVAYAHRNLIVHRDLKPSNVLVTREGKVKLLDFGIGKLLAHDELEDELLTRTGAVPMTRAYAAPEQILGEPVTTATDVYALGVVLYEMVTGERPHRRDAQAPAALAAMVDSETVTRPSEKIRGQAKDLTARRLVKRLKGDLDTIALTALKREPERRYASAEALLEDLRRHADGLPVRARPDTAGYRIGKFLRRHRIGVAGTALVILALIGGLAATLWQAGHVRLQAELAEQEALRAQQTVEFLTTLLEQADPDRAQGAEVTVRQVLDQAARSIDVELSTQPRLQAAMQALIGRVYGQLDLFNDAETQLAGAIAKLSRLDPEDHEIAATSARLAQVYLGLGRWDEAERLARDSLEMRRRILGNAHPAMADSLISLAWVYYKRGRPDDGRELIEQALELLDEGARESLATTLNIAARIEMDAGELGRAEQLSRRAVEAWRGIDPPRTRGLVQALEVHAGTLLFLGQPEQLEEAEQLWLEAIAIERDLLGERHHRPAVLLGNLASTRSRLGDFEGGERALMEALDVTIEVLGPDHPAVGTQLNNIAVFYHRQAKWPEAIDYYNRTIDLSMRVHEENHPVIGTTRAYLGLALHMAGDDRAEVVYRTALTELIESRTSEHEKIGNLRTDLGLLLAQAGRYSEAEPELREGLTIVQPIFGDEDRRTDNAHTGLGFTLCGLGRVDEGEAMLRLSRQWRENRYPEQDWRLLEMDLYDVECLLQRDRRDEAEAQLEVTMARLAATESEHQVLTRLGQRLQTRALDNEEARERTGEAPPTP